jgi:DNA-binding NtrC family response regulator
MPAILILDDEPVACDSLRILLQSLKKWDVETAVTPTQALNSAMTRPPDLFVVDWNLGAEINGLQVADAVRKIRPGLPVIVMTGYPSDEIYRQSTALPRTWLIGKPCPYHELLGAIEDALRSVEQEKNSG